jgi:hypothetical protein
MACCQCKKYSDLYFFGWNKFRRINWTNVENKYGPTNKTLQPRIKRIIKCRPNIISLGTENWLIFPISVHVYLSSAMWLILETGYFRDNFFRNKHLDKHTHTHKKTIKKSPGAQDLQYINKKFRPFLIIYSPGFKHIKNCWTAFPWRTLTHSNMYE